MGSSLSSLAAALFCVATGAQATTVPAGTRVIVETGDPLSSQTLRPGDTFALRLAQPIVADGKTLVPAGATGGGQVVDAARAGLLGKPAKLILAARYLDVDGRQVKLRGMELVRAGQGRDGEAFGAVILIGVLGFLVKGGDIEVPAGATAEAKLAEDLIIPDEPETVAK